jgi:alanine dehydrogenase
MNIGVPKEKRPFEYRVGLPPAGVRIFVQYGHTVYVESGAGVGAGYEDDDYIEAGAHIVYSDEEALGRADLVLKFTRPLLDEFERMRPNTALAGFLHLAAARQDKIDIIQERSLTSISYEQVREADGYHPILTPLSQIGGQMVAQVAARLLQNDHGGRGILLGGAPGVPSAEIVILGAGNVGSTAAGAFSNAGAQVTVLDVDFRQLQRLQDQVPVPLVTMLSTPYNIQRACAFADVVVGAVLVPGERTPIIVTREMVAQMKPRAIIIDMSIDQGGCVETSRPTNHGSPTYIEEGVIHYCVPNMSGVLGRTATYALYNSAFRYFQAMAHWGVDKAIEEIPSLYQGVSTHRGKPVHLKRVGGNGGQET